MPNEVYLNFFEILCIIAAVYIKVFSSVDSMISSSNIINMVVKFVNMDILKY